MKRDLLKLSLSILLASALGGAQAQTSGKLRLLVDPGDSYEFVLDRKFRMQQREVELAPGPHHFSFWAPARQITDTVVHVQEGRTTDFFIRLPYSQEYVAYSKQLNTWRAKRNLQRRLAVLLTVGSGVVTLVNHGKLKDAKSSLDADRVEYEQLVVPEHIATLKRTTIPDHKEDLRRARNGTYIAGGATLALAGLTYFIYTRTGKDKQPHFHDTERVRFDGLVWVPGPQGGQWSTQLSLALSR